MPVGCLSVESAARRDVSFIFFLVQILKLQKKVQEDKAVKRWVKLSHLPEMKMLKEFDFDFQPSINRKQIQELSSLAFYCAGLKLDSFGVAGCWKNMPCYSFCSRCTAAWEDSILHYTVSFDG